MIYKIIREIICLLCGMAGMALFASYWYAPVYIIDHPELKGTWVATAVGFHLAFIIPGLGMCAFLCGIGMGEDRNWFRREI